MRALIKAIDYINFASREEVAAILTGLLDIPADDLKLILNMNIYSNAVDDPTVANLTKLLAYGGRPDIGWTAKVYRPEDIYDLHLLKDVAPKLVTAKGFEDALVDYNVRAAAAPPGKIFASEFVASSDRILGKDAEAPFRPG